MIEFACRCNFRFSLPEDQAGGVTQCPQCHRLVDIPTLSDVGHIDADGNYKFEDDGIIPLADEGRLDVLRRSFTRDRVDSDGSELDLRPTMQDVLKAGTVIPLSDESVAPKYDPLTGELVRPIDVKSTGEERIHPASVPMAKRAVEYAGGHFAASPSITRIGMRLLEPVNLFVMFIIVIVHLIIQPMNLMMLAGIFFVVPVWFIGVGFLMAHYGNVVEEMGPGDHDELPRPLRDAELHGDIWRPFTHVFGALILCYWPLLLAGRGAPLPLTLGLILLGSFFYPAVLLTLATSGSPVNLRPDRVMGVIARCGPRYFTLVGLFIAADLIYGLGLWRLQFDSIVLFVPRSTARNLLSSLQWWFNPWIGYGAFFVGIYLMHWFCWSLGAMYRVHHDQFPWILQRHISTRLRERTQMPPGAPRPGNTNSAVAKARIGK